MPTEWPHCASRGALVGPASRVLSAEVRIGPKPLRTNGQMIGRGRNLRLAWFRKKRERPPRSLRRSYDLVREAYKWRTLRGRSG